MKIFLWILLLPTTMFSVDVFYQVTDSSLKQLPKDLYEIMYKTQDGFYRDLRYQNIQFDAFVTTNQEQETLKIDLIKEEETNTFIVRSNILVTPSKEIDMKDLPLIPFPEVQLKNFVQDTEQEKIEYYAIRMDVLNVNRFVAKKLPKTNDGLIPVQITAKGIIPSIIKFIYYFSPEDGIAKRKEGYFLSRNPSYTMERIDKIIEERE